MSFRDDPIYLKNEKRDTNNKIAELEHKQRVMASNDRPLSFSDQASLVQLKKNQKEIYSDIERVKKVPESERYYSYRDPKAYSSNYDDYDSDD